MSNIPESDQAQEVEELFGVDADLLRDSVHEYRPDLAASIGADGVLLGLASELFSDPETLAWYSDPADRASIVARKLNKAFYKGEIIWERL